MGDQVRRFWSMRMRRFSDRLHICTIFLTLSMLFHGQALAEEKQYSEEKINVLVKFQGGDIDKNISHFYKYLYENGHLPLRPLFLPKGLSVEEALIKEKVFFKNPPKDFDPILVELNRKNPQVEIISPSEQGEPKRLKPQPDATIIVPALYFEKYEYLTSIELRGESLKTFVEKENLLRKYNDEVQRVLSLESHQEKSRKFLHLNPEYSTSIDITKLKEGRFIFPGDGFQTEIQWTSGAFQDAISYPLLQEPLRKGNLYLQPAKIPIMVRANLEGSLPSSIKGASPNQECQDPFQQDFRKHLDHINHRFPPQIKNISKQLTIFVIDRFPDLPLEKRRHRDYQKKVNEFLKGTYAIDKREREDLDSDAKTLGITPEVAKRLEQEVHDTGGVPDVSYDLQDEFEFREEPATVQGEIGKKEYYDENLDHGLHVSAIIGARCNGYGISGVHPLINIVAYNLKNSPVRKIFEEITYRFRCKSKTCIVNISWTAPRDSINDLIDLIERLAQEFLVVAAAGDKETIGPGGQKEKGRLSRYTCRLDPACLGELPNVITVTAFMDINSNIRDPRANYGDVVSIAAPGVNVLSAIRGNKFIRLDGTSQATPFVTGAAAILHMLNPNWKPQQIKNRLLYTADVHVDYADEVEFGRLNVQKASEYPDKDVVYLGQPQPLVGDFEFRRPGSEKWYHKLDLYKEGQEEVITSCKLHQFRRILKNPRNPYYTVICAEEQEIGNGKKLEVLKIWRDVNFYPRNLKEEVGGWLTEAFRLNLSDNTSREINLDHVMEMIAGVH